jgi:DNA-binding transcriptional regulator YhcF (GntR family)
MTRMGRNNTPAPTRFAIDLHTGVPVYRQLIDQVRSGIASGSLTAGDQLPTVRQLAVDLAINPNTVMRAYREMEQEAGKKLGRTGTSARPNGRGIRGSHRRRRIHPRRPD